MPYSKSLQSDEQWHPRTVGDYTTLYLSGIASPTDICENIIENIKNINSKLNIICDLDEELIREQALESSNRYRSGVSLGPLDGVPCVVKDQIWVKGRVYGVH